MITHFRVPKYRQLMGTAESLIGGLGGGHFSLSSTFLHNLGSTRRTSMTNLCHHYSSKGPEWASTNTHPKWQCHPCWVPGMHLLSSLPCPRPHTHTAQLCWGSSRTGARFTRYPPEAWDKAAEEEESVSLDEGGEECKGSIDCKWYDEALLSSQFISETSQQHSPHHHS